MEKLKSSEDGFTATTEEAKKQREQENLKKSKKKSDKPGFFKRLGGKIKDIFSELKKVTWPSFSKVVKNTGVVLVIVLVFLVVITAFDFGLGQLLNLVAPRA